MKRQIICDKRWTIFDNTHTHTQNTHTKMNLLKREREFGFLLLLKSWTSRAVVVLPLVVMAEIKTKKQK